MQNPIEGLTGIATAKAFLTKVAKAFEINPFKPHSVFSGGHAQTIAAYAWPRRFRFASERDEERLFAVAPGVKVLAHCRWQSDVKASPTIVVWHGIEGSTSSNYMQAMAEKGSRAGFNVIRVNFRNCGGTEHLTSTIYHGGLSADLRAVVKELIEKITSPGCCWLGFHWAEIWFSNLPANTATIHLQRFSGFAQFHRRLT